MAASFRSGIDGMLDWIGRKLARKLNAPSTGHKPFTGAPKSRNFEPRFQCSEFAGTTTCCHHYYQIGERELAQ